MRKIDGVPVFQLLQWKHAIRLEAKGIKFGRSVHAHAKHVLGITGNREKVIAHIQTILDESKKQ